MIMIALIAVREKFTILVARLNNHLRQILSPAWLMLITAALVMQVIFLWFISGDQQHAVTQAHGHVGYNFYKKNSIWMSPTLSYYVAAHPFYSVRGDPLTKLGSKRPACPPKLAKPEGLDKRRLGRTISPISNTLFNFSTVRTQNFTDLSQAFPVNDTVGYGVVLGLLWKLTGSLHYHDVQILQILLYLLSLVLVFQIAVMLFGSTSIAWWCLIAHLFFLPLIALNVQAVRDVWAYYGTVLLLWGVLRFLHGKNFLILVLCGIGVALCQWVRPTVFLAVLMVIGVLVLLVLLKRNSWRKILICISCLGATNLVIFWLPFMTYNKVAYNRLMVGPIGQDLLEGLGEFENPWGFELSDEFVATFIGQKYQLQYGTPEFDDKAKEEFLIAYKQQPSLYWRNIFKRLPNALLPGLPWLFPKESPFAGVHGWQAKIKAVVSSWSVFWDFMLRHVYIRLFLLLGYVGMAVALYRRNYVAVFLALAIMIGGLGKLPSHIEYRYLVPFYWVFSLWVGYLVAMFIPKQNT